MNANIAARPLPEQSFRVDSLHVQVYSTRALMGRAAARDVAAKIRELIAGRSELAMIFAAAPSQNEFLAELSTLDGIPWQRITAFHMDEYVGLSSEHPQSFGSFLRERIFGRVPFGTVHYLNGDAPDPAAECERYASLLRAMPPDIVCLGIGENGHIAFNDPDVADFDDPLLVKLVDLDERSRVQQVHDGCFPTLEQVPKQALTLTIPALTMAPWMFCVVPGPTKTAAVKATLLGPITEECPATVLRMHPGATLYLDRAAAEAK
ncbi:MAG TPA: glucosamine-6-phosphate deaminase [Anaerolineae bacterium]|nr:glucosamine-6-phosphate deaminase [Anaerolineae bacterium]